ncbi:ABC transporter ATP-binding protein [Acinetobacter guillouiae]|uniref:ABC transporter ATP-binding protein n=1 Tax=Acinetobacter guillouiae TaxID=106649 RepID=UPI003AF66791
MNMNESSLTFSHQIPEVDRLQPIIEVSHLSIDLHDQNVNIPILKDINFTLLSGKSLGLVGESGAGKSILLKSLVRQLPTHFKQSNGKVELLGQAIDTFEQNYLGRQVTFIPQDPMTALNPKLTIRRHLQEQLKLTNILHHHFSTLIASILQEVNLSLEILDQLPTQLSGGMCQRIMIALAFITRPKLVICDEVTTALDHENCQKVVQLIQKMQQLHQTSIIFVTHDLPLAAEICHDIIVLYAGEVIEHAAAETLFTQPSHPYTEALLRARPQFKREWQMLHPLSGHMPSPLDLLDIVGCRFYDRCPYHKETICSNHAIKLKNLAHDHNPHLSRCVVDIKLTQKNEVSSSTLEENDVFTQLGTATPFFIVENLHKSYYYKKWFRQIKQEVLHDISFSIVPGEFVGIIGESGSGKSTLAKVLMGLENFDRGQIRLNQQLLHNKQQDWSTRIQSLQMIFQNNYHALNPTYTVKEILTQNMEYRLHLYKNRDRIAKELLQAVDLSENLLDRYPQQLSGGQRQRINIGRALCNAPQLLIADEIVSGLDVSVQAKILNLLLELRHQYKIALLLISHDLNVVNYLCSKVIVMQKGHIVEQGPTKTVFFNPQHPYTRSLVQQFNADNMRYQEA